MDSEIIKFENVTFGYQDNQPVIFKNLDFSCPGGFVNLTGPNGVGKTTFLLLAGGRLLPQNGNIFIKNINTMDIESEEERNLLCSFVYQNMEFESDDEAETLLEYIFQNGNLTPEQKNQSFYNDICKVLELQGLMKKTAPFTYFGVGPDSVTYSAGNFTAVIDVTGFTSINTTDWQVVF